MEYLHNRELTDSARSLRKHMTKEEKHLWYDFLRDHPVRFQRQKVMDRYIVDFYCAQANLVIELDGSQHYEEDGLDRDEQRDAYLKSVGLKVIHVTNKEIRENFKGVCFSIEAMVNTSHEGER